MSTLTQFIIGVQSSNIVALASNTVDCSLGNYFTRTVSANTTFTFTNVPSGKAFGFTLEITHTGGTITFPSSVKWPDNITPNLIIGKTHLLMFVTDNGGARWRGAALPNYDN